MKRYPVLTCLALLCLTSAPVRAQTDDTAEQDLLTQEELQTMVAPVALYPDTLLMQVLVAATEPLDVMKADQHLLANTDEDDEARKDYAESQDWEESVQILTAAFPDVISDMAEHIDWTESLGDAMLTQSDDVMDAVQTMRLRAVDNGTLSSGTEQTVGIEDSPPASGGGTSSGSSAERTVVIQPTDPQTVYVPQYNPNTVYSNNLGNVLTGTAVAFGTAALIDNIFDDDDDDWNDYWGCRDCGGWHGRPPVVRPDRDINVDGNVNIGNRLNIDRDKIAWKPDQRKVEQARRKLANHRGPDGRTQLPIRKAATAQDGLRKAISERSRDPAFAGHRDLGKASAHLPPPRRPQVHRPSKFTPAEKSKAIQRTKSAIHAKSAPAHRAGTVARKPVLHRPAVSKKPVIRHKTLAKPSALKKHAPALRTRAASHRGHLSRHHAGGARGKFRR